MPPLSSIVVSSIVVSAPLWAPVFALYLCTCALPLYGVFHATSTCRSSKLKHPSHKKSPAYLKQTKRFALMCFFQRGFLLFRNVGQAKPIRKAYALAFLGSLLVCKGLILTKRGPVWRTCSLNRRTDCLQKYLCFFMQSGIPLWKQHPFSYHLANLRMYAYVHLYCKLCTRIHKDIVSFSYRSAKRKNPDLKKVDKKL